ncbi:MAG: futalosine hydrolase [Flavipsychrobacter sp.]
MRNILLIAATEAEIAPLIKFISTSWQCVEAGIFQINELKLHVQVCGIGMLATAYHLTKKLNEGKYDLVVQAGVGGSYDRSIDLGSIVWVKKEQLGDLRVEDNEDYLDVFDIGLIKKNEYPFTNKMLPNPYSSKDLGVKDLEAVDAVTVNTVTGKQATIDYMNAKYNVATESMEGAALHYICLQEKVMFLQIRGISNYVEPRNRDSWKMEDAIANMNKYLIKYFINI